MFLEYISHFAVQLYSICVPKVGTVGPPLNLGAYEVNTQAGVRIRETRKGKGRTAFNAIIPSEGQDAPGNLKTPLWPVKPGAHGTILARIF